MQPMFFIALPIVIFLVSGGFYYFHQLSSSKNYEHYIADSIRFADSIAAVEAYNVEQAEQAQAETTDDGTICPEPRCGGVEVAVVVGAASHTLENQGSNSYQVSNLLDGDSNTAWATHFTGNEEQLTFHMNADRLYKMYLFNGYSKSAESFSDNSRAKDIKIYVNGMLDSQNELNDEYTVFPEWIIFNKEYKNAQEVKIVISSVYQGNKWNDLCISDVCFYTKE